MRAPVISPSAPPTVPPVLVAGKPVAAAPVALPAGAGVAAGFVAVAVLAGLGIGWNSLGPKDQAKAVGAVTRFFTDQVSSGKMTLGQVGGLISGLLAGGSAGAAGVLQRNLSPAQRKELERTVMAAAPLPTPEELKKIIDALPTVLDCKKRPREDLIGQCGKCTWDAFGELRKLGIRALRTDLSEIVPDATPGAHVFLKIVTTAGEYILDCTFGQFGGRNFDGPNVFFGKLEDYINRITRMVNRLKD